MGAIKSSRIFGESKVRYSFISTDGSEMIDISDTIEDILGDVDGLVVEEEKEYRSRCRCFGKDC
nr:3664_t:CDS:2 [Entrophospora candida]